MRMSLSDILTATGAVGDIGERGNPTIEAVRIDSRAIVPGCLFVCVPGARLDGHHFAAEAVRKGAAAVLADRPLAGLPEGTPVLLVRDTVAALGRLARAWRERVRPKLVAVTGSAGKTTVKELTAAILGKVGPTAKNYKNFNNHIGLPLSMLEAGATDSFWVMEIGISAPGEMDVLAAIAEPDVAVIHNVGPAHLEALGDVAGVAAAKTELFRHMMPGGLALASMDYPELWEAAKNACPDVIGMSTRGHPAPYRAKYLGALPEGARPLLPQAQGPGPGGRNAADRRAFRREHPGRRRLRPSARGRRRGHHRRTGHGRHSRTALFCRQHGCYTVIDDTYNANPLSMRRAIEAAHEAAHDQPLVLVLGEMREMGRESDVEHAGWANWPAPPGPGPSFFTANTPRPWARDSRAAATAASSRWPTAPRRSFAPCPASICRAESCCSRDHGPCAWKNT